MTRRNWKRVQPNSLREALEQCKEHARERLNKSVDNIAEDMGLADKWSLYKWIQNGSMPAKLIRPYQIACGINLVSRWLAASEGRLLVDIPTGRAIKQEDLHQAHSGFAQAMSLISDFCAGKADQATTLEAIRDHLQLMGRLHGNVQQHHTPELEFGE
ncbi:hypothetical protein [Comamonas resistens]|uniref:hypothetical protein n=1 Tax=Comamonas resistens TaxID=3046670 RepID=UPI0039BC6E2D